MISQIASLAPARNDGDDDDNETPEGDKARQPNMGPQLGQILFRERTILLIGEIDMKSCKDITAQLMAMAAEGDDDITLYINSPGGHVESGDTIHDTIRFIKPRVRVVGSGWVASMGAMIYLAAEKKDRFCLPHTRFMLHQPLGGVGGKATDIDIEAREIIKMRQRINQRIAEATGQKIERVEKDTDRNFWMSAEEAKDYGVVGKIIGSMDELK
jgi:ATP-dependent Clp protease protease subunit